MSKRSFTNPADPRTATVSDLRVGQPLRHSTIRHIRSQRRGGATGVRITLADHSSAWGRPDQRQTALEFARRA